MAPACRRLRRPRGRADVCIPRAERAMYRCLFLRTTADGTNPTHHTNLAQSRFHIRSQRAWNSSPPPAGTGGKGGSNEACLVRPTRRAVSNDTTPCREPESAQTSSWRQRSTAAAVHCVTTDARVPTATVVPLSTFFGGDASSDAVKLLLGYVSNLTLDGQNGVY